MVLYKYGFISICLDILKCQPFDLMNYLNIFVKLKLYKGVVTGVKANNIQVKVYR